MGTALDGEHGSQRWERSQGDVTEQTEAQLDLKRSCLLVLSLFRSASAENLCLYHGPGHFKVKFKGLIYLL